MKLPDLDNARLFNAVRGLARNPAASQDILRKLMRVPGIARDIASRSAISDDLAEELLKAAEELGDASIVFTLDRDDAVSALTRRRLTTHLSPKLADACRELVRQSVALGNVPIPLRRLERLTGSIGPVAWTKLAKDPDWQIRQAVAKAWEDAPEKIRRALLTDPEPDVRAAACQAHPPPPVDLHMQLISDPETRPFVAEYIALTPELAAGLASDPDIDVQIALAKNPSLPRSARARLTADYRSRIWVNLICNAATTEAQSIQLYEELARAEEATPWGIVILDGSRLSGWFKTLPLARALEFLDSPLVGIRRQLAKRRDLTTGAVERLDRDPDLNVRRFVAKRVDAPAEMLEQLVRESLATGRHNVFYDLAGHPKFPVTAFASFAAAPEAELRIFACSHRGLPAALIAQLAHDEDAKVRRSAAGHPKLTAEDAILLIADPDGDVVEVAAAHPDLPLSAIDHIADSIAQLDGYVGFGTVATLPRRLPSRRARPEQRAADMPVLDQTRQDAAFTGLARNPAASAKTLLTLVEHVPHNVIAGLLHSRSGDGPKEIPDEVVRALVSFNPREADLLQEDNRVSSDMRRWLAETAASPERRLVQREMIEAIVKYHEVTLPLEKLERLGEKTGPAAWVELANHSDWQVRRGVAWAWPDAPDDIRRALLIDPAPEVRTAACRSRRIPDDLLSRLINDPAPRVCLAEFIELPPELGAELASDGDLAVRAAVASNPNLPSDVCERLAEHYESWVWSNLIGNEACPAPLRIRLFEQFAAALEKDERSHYKLESPKISAWFVQLPLESAMAYLDGPRFLIRRQLAKRRDLPEEAIARLDRDSDLQVRRSIAQRADAPGEVLEELVRSIPYASDLYDHPNFPKSAFARFAAAPDPQLRAIACHDPHLPAEIIARLVRDPDNWVKRRAAEHRNLPAVEALRLLGEQDAGLVEAAAASPALPATAINHILDYAVQFNQSSTG